MHGLFATGGGMNEHIVTGLSPDNRMALFNEMKPGEVLAWAAEPSPGMRVAGFAAWLVGLPMLGFALLWLAITALPVLVGWAPLNWLSAAATLFGLPFLAVGAMLTIKPFQMRRAALTTVYALTDQRLIELRTGKSPRVVEFAADSILGVDVTEYSDGSGVIDIPVRLPEASGGKAKVRIMGVQQVAEAKMAILAQIGKGA